jgi:hypothetical protein
MAMQTDVYAKHTEATGTLLTYRTRVKGFICLSGGTAGDIILRDNGASGDVKIQFNVPANTNNPFNIVVPGEGVLFDINVHVTLPTGAKLTVFYG